MLGPPAQNSSPADRLLRWTSSDARTLFALALCALPMAAFVTADLPPRAHFALSAALLAVALLASLRPGLRMVVMGLSLAVSARYMYYRATQTLVFEATLDSAAAVLLFTAEAYAFVVLACGYFQTAIVRRLAPVPFDAGRPDLPLVDVFVPSYNEDVDLLADTLAAAMAMDYPRKRVYLLDDGRRPEARALAERLGCHYLIRADNRGAKAGNVNAALPRTEGELIAFFDADHVPVRTFLTNTVGFFLADPKVALVQTPHYFYNADQLERNLHLEGTVPAEQKLFYHAIQPANDFWNGAFFCGSCAVIRRTAMVGVGGMAEETLTEDAHTALKMHAAGWKSVYLDLPLAAGIATERLAFFVSQRARWARGMAQVFRLDNPLLKRGLSLPQRITYFAASWHFLFGLPRLFFVVSPPLYLLFGVHPVFADVREVLAFAVPHLMLAWVGTATANRNLRHSFWPEVVEMVLAVPTAIVTTIALFAPRTGAFKVTTKGATADRQAFDWRRAAPNLALAVLLGAAVLATAYRLGTQPLERGTVLVAGAWNLYNLMILVAAIAVAWEPPQRRGRHRIARSRPMRVRAADGRPARGREGHTQDISPTGARAVLDGEHALPSTIEVQFDADGQSSPWLRARVVEARPERGTTVLRFAFVEMTTEERVALTRFIFSPPESWLGDAYASDRPLRSLLAVALSPLLAARGAPDLARRVFGSARPAPIVRAPAAPCPHTATGAPCEACRAARPDLPEPQEGAIAPRTAAAALVVAALVVTALPSAHLPIRDVLVPLDRWSGDTYAERYLQLRDAHAALARLHAALAAHVEAGTPPDEGWQAGLARVARVHDIERRDFSDEAARTARAEIATALLLLREADRTYRSEGSTPTARSRLLEAGHALARAARDLGMTQ